MSKVFGKRKYSLKAQLIHALLISIIIALAVFQIMDVLVINTLDSWQLNVRYISRKSNACLDSLEKYVIDNQTAAVDTAAINAWHNSNKAVTTIVYVKRGEQILYDSLQEDRQGSSLLIDEEGTPMKLEDICMDGFSDNEILFSREIEFSDGWATVLLYGYYDRWLYDVSLIAEIVLAAIVLCMTFMLMVCRKIEYLIQLEKEIKVLETGGLDYPITVKGRDEIASLADSLNQMRIVLQSNLNKEAETVRSNYNLIVAVSHDIRTPLTSLALYLDLIHAGKYENEEQLNAYLEKSRCKVSQIKQMTDQLFDRFYQERKTESVIEEPEAVRIIFEDSLSGMAGYLEENGFSVQTDICWPERKASVSTDYISRVIDNICSNILKYADRRYPVCMNVSMEEEMLSICFSNRIRPLVSKPDSTGVGVENIEFMMKKMDGRYLAAEQGKKYTIQLLFRLEDQKGKSDDDKCTGIS